MLIDFFLIALKIITIGMVLENINMLTNRELEVLDLLIQGYNNNEISQKLMITNHTTKAHITSIYNKLNVCNRVQAAVKYISMQQQKA